MLDAICSAVESLIALYLQGLPIAAGICILVILLRYFHFEDTERGIEGMEEPLFFILAALIYPLVIGFLVLVSFAVLFVVLNCQFCSSSRVARLHKKAH